MQAAFFQLLAGSGTGMGNGSVRYSTTRPKATAPVPTVTLPASAAPTSTETSPAHSSMASLLRTTEHQAEASAGEEAAAARLFEVEDEEGEDQEALSVSPTMERGRSRTPIKAVRTPLTGQGAAGAGGRGSVVGAAMARAVRAEAREAARVRRRRLAKATTKRVLLQSGVVAARGEVYPWLNEHMTTKFFPEVTRRLAAIVHSRRTNGVTVAADGAIHSDRAPIVRARDVAEVMRSLGRSVYA